MRACHIFYRTLALPLISVSVICAAQVVMAQTALFVFRVFWEKVLTSIVIAIYIAIFRSEQFVFYNNLRFSRTKLLVSTFSLDFLAWVLLMSFTIQFV